MPVAAILFFRMRLISVSEKLTPNEDILQILVVQFSSESVNDKNHPTRGGGSIANAKPKYPPDEYNDHSK